ncbi:contact-dependent growth inhibition system immunity protein [Paraburkholderia sp. MM5482-R1]|uniref:contact-dependent growth inhibition system immunity protein n=1 Tax=unclassified Paraburkholderia TaxID=2615204 RepID=UPI003D225A86
MSYSERYPAMEHIFNVYFGQDFDLFGENVQEIVACYRKDSPYDYENLIREIDSFRSEHPSDLDATFKQVFRRGFRPEGGGYTTASFLDEIQRVLSE